MAPGIFRLKPDSPRGPVGPRQKAEGKGLVGPSVWAPLGASACPSVHGDQAGPQAEVVGSKAMAPSSRSDGLHPPCAGTEAHSPLAVGSAHSREAPGMPTSHSLSPTQETPRLRLHYSPLLVVSFSFLDIRGRETEREGEASGAAPEALLGGGRSLDPWSSPTVTRPLCQVRERAPGDRQGRLLAWGSCTRSPRAQRKAGSGCPGGSQKRGLSSGS